MRQVHLALPEGGARVGAVRDPAGRPGEADGHREEENLRHCQRPRGGPDDDQGIVKAEVKNLDLEWSTLGITSLPTLKIFQESSSFLSQLAQIFHETSHHAPA